MLAAADDSTPVWVVEAAVYRHLALRAQLHSPHDLVAAFSAIFGPTLADFVYEISRFHCDFCALIKRGW